MNNLLISQGEIWYVNLDPVVGHEQGKKRPCLVVSRNELNQGVDKMVTIIPLTSRFRPIRWWVPIPQSLKILPKATFVICNQVRTVSSDRFSGNSLGVLPPFIFDQVRRRLKILLDL